MAEQTSAAQRMLQRGLHLFHQYPAFGLPKGDVCVSQQDRPDGVLALSVFVTELVDHVRTEYSLECRVEHRFLEFHVWTGDLVEFVCCRSGGRGVVLLQGIEKFLESACETPVIVEKSRS